jgi:pimeloyl-ACP methyl ester carboxylesterase
VANAFADAIERDGLEAAGARFVWGPESGLDPEGARLVRQGFLEHPPHALAAILRNVLAREPAVRTLAAALSGVTVPALVIAGANDHGGRLASEALATALPRARLALIADAGHLVNLARPTAFNTELRAFLETVA